MMKKLLELKKKFNEDERGSADVFAFLLTMPIIIGLIFVVIMSMLWREAIRLPVNQIVETYTQQYAAYGTDTPPEYAAFSQQGLEPTVTGRMRNALEGDPYVRSVGLVECGALLGEGQIDPTAIIYANTAVGCQADVELVAWPYAATLEVTDLLFGGDYSVYATGYTDRGENINLR